MSSKVSSLVDLCLVNIILNKQSLKKLGCIKEQLNSCFNVKNLEDLSVVELLDISYRNNKEDIKTKLRKIYIKELEQKKFKNIIYNYDIKSNTFKYVNSYYNILDNIIYIYIIFF